MRLRGATGLVLCATSLTLAMAGPVLRSPDTRLFGWEIVGRHQDPFVVIRQFETPSPLGLYTQPATDYVGAAVAALTGNGVIAYNVMVLASFPLAALFAYLLALRLTGSRLASWLAGLLYAFSPFHIAQSAYHPHGAQTQWLPLYLLALLVCLEGATARRLALLAVSLMLVSSSNFYYGLMAALLTPLAVLGFWLVQRRTGRAAPGLKRTGAFLGLLAVIGLVYVAVVAPTVLVDPDRVAFPRSDLALYGARPASYWVPPVGHPLAARFVDEYWQRPRPGEKLEQQITVGLGLTLLALIAIGFYSRGERDGAFAATPALVLLGSVAFVVSLAPPDSLGEYGPRALLWPSTLVYELLPMFRAYARFALIVMLAIAILGSVGAMRLLRSDRAPARIFGIGLLILVLAELTPFPPFRWRDVLPTSAHSFLETQEGPIRVLDCVPASRLADRPIFYRFAHGISIPAGITDCGDPDLPVQAAADGFTHLLIRANTPLADWLSRGIAPKESTPVGSFQDSLLFELTPDPQVPLYLEFKEGFHWREYRGNETFRWMRGIGTLLIVNPSDEAMTAALDLKLHAFPEGRLIEVALDGRPLGDIEVGTEPRTYGLPAVSIDPGRHVLTLRARSPAVVADEVLGNGDLRELSVALWNWSLTLPSPAI